ncbi:TRAP transporter small permease [Pseudohoeflea suaedae]|uniref:TRAP transporter small permease protein n=1 Tax=Pseudohoeflea suaedae TaxID=877384 RepID=A0A4R5PJ40_9HYPH|nr:TRAP transporter small permease [Pseudohoeflea suaedae]TDH35660.1 TRAP transporter small permease [Pseudohoeflea suaedae]
MLRTLEWIDRMVAVVLRPVVFAGTIALAAVITLQIVSRVFFTSFAWTEEVARFLLIWITFLGAALAFQQARHIAVTFVRDLMPLNLRRIITGAGILVAIAFLVTLAMIGWKYSGIQSFQKSPSLRISMFWVYLVMPASAAIMTFLSVVDLVRLLAGHDDRTAAPEGLE